jgi:hypothetical protein
MDDWETAVDEGNFDIKLNKAFDDEERDKTLEKQKEDEN